MSVCILGLVGCSGEPAASEPEASGSAMSFEEFVAQAYQEPDTGLYIVDGDTPARGLGQLRALYESYLGQRSGLAVNQWGGVDTRWSSSQQLNLTYCVSTNFGSYYSTVVSAMAGAAADWQAVANVRFVHRSNQDGSCTDSNNSVVFDVRFVSGQPYLARAFFPGDPRFFRNILIDASSFGNIAPYSLRGVLRHELGHVLGFRHEHTRPEAGTCFEDSNWRALTPYDSASVMHYPQCRGTNGGDLVLTAYDQQGTAALYGAPAPRSGTVLANSAGITSVIDTNWQVGGTGDFDRNGVPDILWRHASSGQNSIWYMGGTNGASLLSSGLITAVSDANWRIEGAGDFNRDGVPDILWRNYSSGQNSIWYMGGAAGGSVVSSTLITAVTDTSWRVGGIGDFNLDGVPDLVWRNASSGQNSIWYMGGGSGASVVSSILITAVTDTNWQVGGVGDFNLDGVSDILWRNYGSGQNSIWYMGGPGGATLVSSALIPPLSGLSWRIESADDFNADGVPDILWRNYGSGDNALWYMGG